ncbi:sugar phosphate isomerase/epimerase [Catenibacillus scindens]|uniref:Sugar phosphate isomerase/epimerase n=1 Tax=Catenibacillus scindens TaxID=673271 RepID=A0A7W8H7I8_9FIRM|nr:TIM barrel protein [Catenibacillus scindens]MBB5263346.1 sugar phosphate isomerase/epimerase [Catenibacillus scindens]
MGIKSSVSLYSLQYQFLWGKMTLEDLFKYMKDLHVDGIELLPDQMLKGTPEPSEETYAMWHNLVNKYGLGLACDDIFLNTNLYKNRELTKRECIDLIKKEIIMAHRLGFKVIRLVSMVPAWILEPCLETAAKNDVALCIEVHGGLGFDVPKTEEFLKEMIRLDSPYIGIVPDTSLFCRRPPRVVSDYCRQVYGTNPEIIKYAEEVFASGTDFFALNVKNGGMDPKLKSLIKDPAKDMFFAQNLEGYENRPLSCMDPYVKYIKHFHFKLYEMTEEGTEYSIDYKEVLEYLHKHGYNGYVSTEYEGNRWVLPDHEIPEKEQVAAHQKLIQKLIKEIEG